MPDISSSLWSGLKLRKRNHELPHAAFAGQSRSVALDAGGARDSIRACGNSSGGRPVVCARTEDARYCPGHRRDSGASREQFARDPEPGYRGWSDDAASGRSSKGTAEAGAGRKGRATATAAAAGGGDLAAGDAQGNREAQTAGAAACARDTRAAE